MNETKPIIRNAKETDLGELLSIQKAAFMRYTDHLLPEQLPPLSETLEELRNDLKGKQILVAEMGASIKGSVRYYFRGGVCIVDRLSVHPEFQGKGMGRSLMSEIEKRAKKKCHKIYLETGLLAHNLIMFYTLLGYSAEAVLRNHFDRHDWIVFSKFI